MNRWSRTVQLVVASIALAWVPATAGVAQADPAPYVPTQGVESKYFQPGPAAVTEKLGFGCCDSTGAKFDVWYPADLGATRHPIVVWGDGTSAVPSQYVYLLRHLASWGFVVIGTENQNTGSGADIRKSLDYLLAQDGDPASVFYGKLDKAAVGAMGHSQGASGVLNALRDAGGAIKTAVPLELPAQHFCSNSTSCADTRSLTTGSVFLVNGSADGLISPSQQLLPWQAEGLQSNQAYYEATPANLAKAWGTLNGPNHNDVQGQPDCAGASVPCTTGVYGYLGYPTAWLMAQLRGDTAAQDAFRPGGEFSTPSPNWSNQVSAVAG
ncbi:alpha/beta hydrolase [Nocardia colli]|uniref:Alpha/beta hydrolase n=1 Tax=Nocardia colli TaxID=2545717 RepID=A0A5N0E7D9_9NOCA|nr:alpha/beta hydrolase [Nocardia colli]KAA8884863.1 alpha/beta hydrolase [Nocardia colli]